VRAAVQDFIESTDLSVFADESQLRIGVSAYMKTIITGLSPQRETDFFEELVRLTRKFIHTTSASHIDTLERELSKLSVVSQRTVARTVFSCLQSPSKGGDLVLHMEIPDLTNVEESNYSNLAAYLSLIGTLFNVDPRTIKVTVDSSWGTSCPLNASTKRSMDNFIRSVKEPQGLSGFSRIKVNDKLSCNLPGILYMLKMLIKYQPFIRKSGKKPVTQEFLKGLINDQLGLKAELAGPWVRCLLRDICKELTMVTFEKFPPSFSKAATAQNKIKSIASLIYKLGYTPVECDPSKAVHVLTTKISPDYTDKKFTFISKQNNPKEFEIPYKDFAAGVRLILPRLDLSKGSPKLTDQVKAYGISKTSKSNLIHMKKYAAQVDELNLAYAFLSSLEKPGRGTKTKPSNYINQKGKFVNHCWQITLQSKDGQTFGAFKELPLPVRKWFGKLLGRDVQAKRVRDQSHESDRDPSTLSTDMEDEVTHQPSQRPRTDLTV